MIQGLSYPDGRTLNTVQLRAVTCIVMPNTRHFPNLWLVSYTNLSSIARYLLSVYPHSLYLL